jgi:AcrR family transcriptional regulator
LTPILTAALDAFYTRGYEATTVRDLARRLGVTVPALYYHHENKEAILYELLDRSIEKVAEVCRAALAEAGDDTGLRFLNLVEAIALYEVQATKLARLDHDIRSLSPDNAERYRAKRRVIEDMMSETIRRGSDEGLLDVTNVVYTARAILGMLQSLAMWYRPGRGLSPREMARIYREIASQAAGASPELLKRAREE